VTHFLLASEDDTARFARAIAEGLRYGYAVGLSGDLGAGKTTFVRYLVAALGGGASSVSSPSFTLEHEYRVSAGRVVDHWDLYRISELPDELVEPPDSDVVRLIEWPERCEGLSVRLDLMIRFEVSESGERRVSIEGPKARVVNEVVQERYGSEI
jgi:tRNA threonylcarbamoyl adenosine modification protein YjeE